MEGGHLKTANSCEIMGKRKLRLFQKCSKGCWSGTKVQYYLSDSDPLNCGAFSLLLTCAQPH